jgi:translation initiation factor 6
VYCAANESLAVVGRDLLPKAVRSIEETLQVPVVRTLIGSTNIVGSLLALNAQGAIVTGFASPEEQAALRGLRTLVLPHRLNAAGNNILCNDRGAVVNPGYDDKTIRGIGEALGVEAARGTIAGMRTIGSAGVATNKGAIAHPHATEAELAMIRDVLKVPTMITTANYGTAQLGACMVANSKGAVVGGRTTSIELGRIEEGLGYY